MFTKEQLDYLIVLMENDLARKGTTDAEQKYLDSIRNKRLHLVDCLVAEWHLAMEKEAENNA